MHIREYTRYTGNEFIDDGQFFFEEHRWSKYNQKYIRADGFDV
jgi:hypothetical protein